MTTEHETLKMAQKMAQEVMSRECIADGVHKKLQAGSLELKITRVRNGYTVRVGGSGLMYRDCDDTIIAESQNRVRQEVDELLCVKFSEWDPVGE